MGKFLFLFFSLFALTTQAVVKPLYTDIKLQNQVMLFKQSFGTPAAAGTADVLSGNAGATSAAAASVTTFVAQPDVPRNLVITPAGTTADVAACTVTVTGTNIYGRSITEAFAFADNAATATTGAKAFKTVTSVAWAASCEEGGFAATWSVGYGEKIGLSRCLDVAGNWSWSTAAGSYETTRATVVADSDEVEKNTADFNGTMNGSNAFFGYFVENFLCKP